MSTAIGQHRLIERVAKLFHRADSAAVVDWQEMPESHRQSYRIDACLALEETADAIAEEAEENQLSDWVSVWLRELTAFPTGVGNDD